MAALRRLARWRRLISSDDELESQRKLEAALEAGATPVSEVVDRAEVTVFGELTSITLSPSHDAHWLRGDLSDGSGTLGLMWMGRRTVPGIRAGVKLAVTGRVTKDSEGKPVMYNPAYELAA